MKPVDMYKHKFKTETEFDYEEAFMGVNPDHFKGFQNRVLRSDYRLQRLIEALPPVGGNILDIGCGGGVISECLPYFYPNAQIYGCDISKIALYYAKKSSCAKIKYSLIKNGKLPYNDNFFDVCITLDVMEHVPDINLFLKEITRVLKRNGILFLAVPCEGQIFTITWLFHKIGIGKNLTFKHVGHIHPEFTHKSVINLLKAYKLLPLKISYGEHLIIQLLRFFLFLLPKEMLELFLGKKHAIKYYDRSVLKKANENKNNKEFFMFIRKAWFKISGYTKVMQDIDELLFKKVSLTAWKVYILAINAR